MGAVLREKDALLYAVLMRGSLPAKSAMVNCRAGCVRERRESLRLLQNMKKRKRPEGRFFVGVGGERPNYRGARAMEIEA